MHFSEALPCNGSIFAAFFLWFCFKRSSWRKQPDTSGRTTGCIIKILVIDNSCESLRLPVMAVRIDLGWCGVQWYSFPSNNSWIEERAWTWEATYPLWPTPLVLDATYASTYAIRKRTMGLTDQGGSDATLKQKSRQLHPPKQHSPMGVCRCFQLHRWVRSCT